METSFNSNIVSEDDKEDEEYVEERKNGINNAVGLQPYMRLGYV